MTKDTKLNGASPMKFNQGFAAGPQKRKSSFKNLTSLYKSTLIFSIPHPWGSLIRERT